MKIAVVIPALDESSQIAATIASALHGSSPPGITAGRRQRSASEGGSCDSPHYGSVSPGAEASGALAHLDIVVADGGSRDGTPALAESAGARVVACERGRAKQLQRGVEAAVGDAIVMLHADTRLPSGWPLAVTRALACRGVSGGAFRFAFDRAQIGDLSPSQRFGLWLVERGARFRSRWLALPYGDQALFVLRSELEAIGGVPQVALMEDLDLVRRLKRRGRIAQIDAVATTSPRRHLERGVWRTAFLHTLAMLAWRVGLDRDRIAGWLRR